MVRQVSRQELLGCNKVVQIAEQQAIGCFHQFEPPVLAQPEHDPHIGETHLAVNPAVTRRSGAQVIAEGMKSANKDAQPLPQLLRQCPVAELQLALFADSHPGALLSRGSVASAPEAVVQKQISMETHPQFTVAAPPRKGRA